MSNHVRRRSCRILVVPFAVSVCLMWARDTRAQSAGDLPREAEPRLAESGDLSAHFNEAQIACYQGSMRACDSIWLNERVLLDTFLGQYGRTCGGRVDLRAIRRANVTCIEAFPGHE